VLPPARAVVASTPRAFVVVDLPFGSYEDGPSQALETAVRVMKETGAQAVKREGGAGRAPVGAGGARPPSLIVSTLPDKDAGVLVLKDLTSAALMKTPLSSSMLTLFVLGLAWVR